MENLTDKHWTERSIEDFTYRIASDFLAQVEMKIEAGEITRVELAHRLDRTPGRVSQILNNPSNLTITSAARLVRAAGMKVALVAYEDNDPENNNGPVNSEIFYRSWKHMGAPKTFFEFASTAASRNCLNAYTVNVTSPVAVATVYTNSGVFNCNTNSPMTTVTGYEDVNSVYVAHHQGMGTDNTMICDVGKTGLVFDESGRGFITNPVGIKAATTTTTGVTQQNYFAAMEA